MRHYKKRNTNTNRKAIAVLLILCMLVLMLTGCGNKQENTAPVQEDAAASYTYRGTYSGVGTWSPTDWEISSEFDMLGYTVSVFYGFWMNETKDGYDIVPELAADFPVDVTADYAGDETYGVPADAAEGYAWQVTMRQDAVWQDGTPITAGDVEYTLQQFLSPEMKNYRASLFYQGGIALANAEGYYNSDKAGGAASVMQYLSDGFFTAAVLYIGCSVLMFIEEAGNFYGLQYLWYTVVRLFSPSKRHLEEKKDYFTYCQEKKERRAEEGKTPLKSAMLFVGLGCLALSLVFMFVFYQAV